MLGRAHTARTPAKDVRDDASVFSRRVCVCVCACRFGLHTCAELMRLGKLCSTIKSLSGRFFLRGSSLCVCVSSTAEATKQTHTQRERLLRCRARAHKDLDDVPNVYSRQFYCRFKGHTTRRQQVLRNGCNGFGTVLLLGSINPNRMTSISSAQKALANIGCLYVRMCVWLFKWK